MLWRLRAGLFWLEPYPDLGPEASYEQRESVELAFVAALQHLPARQRAVVLIMRDVLGFSGAEAAAALQMSPEAVYSALQRAHKAVDERLPERTQQATLKALGDEELRAIVREFVDAWERADVDALAARLAEDVALAMPPNPEWYRGRDTVLAFLRRLPLTGKTRWRVLPTRANGQPAFGHYLWSEEAGAFLASELSVLTLAGDRIAELTVFRDPPQPRASAFPNGLPDIDTPREGGTATTPAKFRVQVSMSCAPTRDA